MPPKRDYRYIIIQYSCCLLFLLIHQFSFGQDKAKVEIYRGSSVPFIFNSLTKYQDPLGLILTNWTRLKIVVDDSRGIATGWELWVKTDSDLLTGDNGNTLPSTYLELKIESAPGFAGDFIETNWVQLTSAGTLIMSDTPIPVTGVEWEVWISYRCGVGSTMWNKPWDSYIENINFFLTSLPL